MLKDMLPSEETQKYWFSFVYLFIMIIIIIIIIIVITSETGKQYYNY